MRKQTKKSHACPHLSGIQVSSHNAEKLVPDSPSAFSFKVEGPENEKNYVGATSSGKSQCFAHQQLTSTTRCRRQTHTHTHSHSPLPLKKQALRRQPLYNLEIGLLSTICERAQRTQTCEKTHRQKSANRLAFADECIIPDVPNATLTPQPLVSKQSIASKEETATCYAIFPRSVQQMQLWGGSNDCTSDGHLKGNS